LLRIIDGSTQAMWRAAIGERMKHVVAITLILTGLLHLLPLTGALGPRQLEALYGVALTDTNLVLLMRHRAILFGILGIFLIAAVWLPVLRTSALMLGLASVGSFLLLALSSPAYNASITRVVMADGAALLLLLLGLAVHLFNRAASRIR
jgi:hypothetical protein